MPKRRKWPERTWRELPALDGGTTRYVESDWTDEEWALIADVISRRVTRRYRHKLRRVTYG